MKARIFIFAVLSLFVFGHFGCGGEKQISRRAPAKKAKRAPKKRKKPSSNRRQAANLFSVPKDDYSYNPLGKRDPFQKYRGEVVEAVEHPRTALERYALGQLKLTAIIWGISNPRALIMAPDGESYIAHKNTRMGRNRGRVARITRSKLYIQEEHRDPTGKLIVRESIMQIRREGKKSKKSKLQVVFSDSK